MKRGYGSGALLAGVIGAVTLTAGALAPAVASGAATSPAALPGKIALHQAPPHVPPDAAHLGSAPSQRFLNLDVTLAGQDPSGLAAAVAAVSTPGSPDYRHYLSAAQFAARFGPSAAEVLQVTSALRAEGLTVGAPSLGSNLLPVSGPASAVSAAFGTPLEIVQVPKESPALVNTAPPQVSAALAGMVTAVIGLDGLVRQHSMLRRAPATPSPAPSTTSPSAMRPATTGTGAAGSGSPSQSLDVAGHASPQACGAAVSRANHDTGYTSTQMASIYGLDTLLGQGRTGIGQTIGIVEFDRYAQSDVSTFMSCYGLSNHVSTVLVDGGAPPPSQPDPEPAIDIQLAAVSAPSAPLTVYEAPNSVSDASGIDLYSRIASDDTAQVVTTSWGDCEADITPSDLNTESAIFAQMLLQGQTMIAASGDTGSEDCLFDGPSSNFLNVDDPGAQPDVISGGGTTLSSASASSQIVWNDCPYPGAGIPCSLSNSSAGAGGGGQSGQWPKPGYQPNLGSPYTADKRAVPDISGSADPNHGVALYFGQFGGWTTFGGTSIVSPSNAGFFADTNQGCFRTVGGVGPALYAAAGTGNNYFDVTASGNNDLTNTNGGAFPVTSGFDGATGLGTPTDQNLFKALQGGDGTGCPSVAAVSPNTGPVSGGGAITIFGGGFQNATSVSFGSAGAGHIVSQSDTSLTVIPPSASGPMCVDVTVRNAQGISVTLTADHYGFGGNLNCGQGYRFVASDGGIFDYGDATFWGSTGSLRLNAPVVGMAATPSTNGYWMVATDGGIFSFGDAQFFGSMGGQHLNQPIVGMASTANGGGYWMVAADGGIFSFGNAAFFGSTGSMRLNKPIVGMAATPDGGGYWLVASDGGIFSYGDAKFWGSTGSLVLNSPVVGMAPGPGGNGYWLVAADGGIFDYGSAGFFGSAGSIRLNQPVVGMAATSDDHGYWLVASDGGIFTYGDAPFFGSTGSIRLNKPIVGMSSA